LSSELASGARSSFSHDDSDRPTYLTHFRSDDSVIGSFTYTLDAAGRRTRADEDGGDRVDWTYDKTGALLSEVRCYGPNCDRISGRIIAVEI
jgi:YD repeat-containing protein